MRILKTMGLQQIGIDLEMGARRGRARWTLAGANITFVWSVPLTTMPSTLTGVDLHWHADLAVRYATQLLHEKSSGRPLYTNYIWGAPARNARYWTRKSNDGERRKGLDRIKWGEPYIRERTFVTHG